MNMEFDKEAHINRMKPHVDKLLSHLEKKGITFNPNDDKFENVVLTSSTKTVKISHHSFYRFSGICCVCRDLGQNLSETVEVTDSMFMENFMKPIVEVHFGLK